MKRILAKRKRNQDAGLVYWRVMVSVGTFIVLLAAGLFVYQYHRTPDRYPLVNKQVIHFSEWMMQHREAWSSKAADKKNKAKVDSLPSATSAETNNDLPIQFEFYNALPAIKSVNGELNTAVLDQAAKLSSGQVAGDAQSQKKETLPVTKTPIVSSDELEQEMNAALKSTSYAIQLGIFHNPAMAVAYRQALAKQGIDADIVKMGLDKKFFRVQLGPYASKTQAKSVQQTVRKKGVNGLVYKVN